MKRIESKKKKKRKQKKKTNYVPTFKQYIFISV